MLGSFMRCGCRGALDVGEAALTKGSSSQWRVYLGESMLRFMVQPGRRGSRRRGRGRRSRGRTSW